MLYGLRLRSTPTLALHHKGQRQADRKDMEHLRLSLGTIWIICTLVAAAFLGTDFILHEIRAMIRHYRDSGPK